MLENSLNKFKFSEGITLAVISSLGYVIAFVYELSYANVFGYPINFISLGLDTVLISILTVFGLFVPIYLIIDFMVGIIKTKSYENQMGQFIIWGFVLYSLWGLILFLGDSGWYGWLMFIVFFISEYLLEIFIPFFSKDKSKKISERFISYRNRDTEHIRLSIRLISKLSPNVVFVFLIMLFAICTSNALGTYLAKNTDTFFILNNNKQKVVIHSNNKNYIVATIDTVTKKIKDYSIIDPLQTDISISKVKIGKLTVSTDNIENIKTVIDSSKTF